MKKKPAMKKFGRAVKSVVMPDLTECFSSVQLAKAIKAKRTGMKLKLTDVSDVLSISKPTLIKLEKGDTRVNFANLLKVMEYLGLSFCVISDDVAVSSKHNGGSEDEWY